MIFIDDNFLKHYSSLSLTRYGYEECESGHSCGPEFREYYLIHFVFKGQGIYKLNGETYTVEKNQGFLISPNELAYYKADSENPWHYAWIGFRGAGDDNILKAANLSSNNPIFTYNTDMKIKNYLLQLSKCNQQGINFEFERMGYLYLFLSCLLKNSNSEQISFSRQTVYSRSVLQYINENYYKKITVDHIAANVGLDRSYLSKIFSKSYNMSIKEYLIRYRMGKARELLEKSDVPINAIAKSVGYDDQFLFSKIFKKKIGLSPLNYRKKYLI